MIIGQSRQILEMKIDNELVVIAHKVLYISFHISNNIGWYGLYLIYPAPDGQFDGAHREPTEPDNFDGFVMTQKIFQSIDTQEADSY